MRGAAMQVLGTIQMLVAGFPAGPLPPEVGECLRDLQCRSGAKVLDLMYVSRDTCGMLSVSADTIELEGGPANPGAVLLQVLEGDQIADPDEAEYEIRPADEIGFDLEAIEGLVYRIPAGTSALIVLVEARWTERLLGVVSHAGGVSRGLGFLEAESMLIVGPQLARAQRAFDHAERVAVECGKGMLDALRSGPGGELAAIAEALEVLVASGTLRDAHLATAIAALADAGVVPDDARAEFG